MRSLRRPVPIHIFPPEEERAHVLTHGAGLVFSVVALLLLAWRCIVTQAPPSRLLGVTVYGLSLVLLYGASTFYHMARRPDLRRALRVADHACVYVLIAGSYTPFMLSFLWGPWGWGLLGAVWTMAAAGVVLKLFCTGRYEAPALTLSLSMGWLCLIALGPLLERMPPGCFALLLAGGVFYTVGIVFYVLDRYRWFHTVWHLFVLAGSASHVLAVARYAIPA